MVQQLGNDLSRNLNPAGRVCGLSTQPFLLTVVVPVYNEEATVDDLLRRIMQAPYDKQVIVVDDGSTDQSRSLLKEWEREAQVQILEHSMNRGKGAAIRTALPYARGQIIIIQDADLEYDPQDYARLIEPLLRGQAEVVYGSRYLQSPKAGRRPMTVFRFGVSVLNLLVRLLYGVRLTDEATCYKAFPTSLLRSLDLQCERFEFCPEVTAKLCRMGLKILEVPIHYNPRTVKAGKKIRWKDGLEAIATLWKWRRWNGWLPGFPGLKAWATQKSRPLGLRESPLHPKPINEEMRYAT